MDNLAADYVRTAMAKGLEFKRAVLGHAFRNSIIPIATNFGENITLFLAGSFLIEKIFKKGRGSLPYGIFNTIPKNDCRLICRHCFNEGCG